MQIIEYLKKYDEDIKDLLVELQEYISSIDKEGYNIVGKDYREKYFAKTMEEVTKYKGKIFLAIENDHAIGLIIGFINNEDEETYGFKAPKRGRITELVVSKKSRKKGVGKLLLSQMENYFKEVGCKGVLLNVFAYNEVAQKLYYHSNYSNRLIELMKKL